METDPNTTPLPAPISVRGASTHNLRGVDLDLPRNQLIVFCGASGSGKTSMAIDTLYAEGQRRYIESFSAYTRQFVDQLDKPEVDQITGLPPSIAVTREAGSRSNRATVATATETANHLRLLYARVGQTLCPECGQPVSRDDTQSIFDRIMQLDEETRAMLGFSLQLPEDHAETTLSLAELTESGYVRAVLDDTVCDVSPSLADRAAGKTIVVVVDRISGSRLEASRITESVEAALEAGGGACALIASCPESEATDTIDGAPWRVQRFYLGLTCDACGIEFRTPEPPMFDFNSPLGACETCEGFGSVVETDMRLVVPDTKKSLSDGAVAPWNTPAYAHELEELLALAPDYNLRVDVPFEELTEDEVRLVIEGVPERDFGGLNGFIKWLERRKYKMHLRVFLSRWRSYRPCPSCHGDRLRPEALAVRLGGKNFAEICRMEVRQAFRWLQDLKLSDSERAIADGILPEVLSRLEYLCDVGVGYLTLDRTLRTLSTGESQRVAMTATLGSNLVDMLYVLDEPSVGLHARDVQALTRAITRLRDRGNTVVVVEHEEETIRSADRVVEFGPQSGVEGGEVVFDGPPQEIAECRASRTGDWLTGRRAIRSDASSRRPVTQEVLTLLGAKGANLRGEDDERLNVEIPLGVLCVVTGVSGAGKSSLIRRTLYPALAERLLNNGAATESRHEADQALPYTELLGSKMLDDVVLVDQQPIGRSPRSNPVTYIKAFDPIRALFAEQPEAQAHGFKASHFSFNVDGGRCETCQGAGFLEIDMQFLADIYMRCRDCDGHRYRKEVLDVKYRGRNIAEVLDMTAHEAFRFFRGQPKVQSRLRALIDVGLDYLQLGQPANTLSGGEAQRLKLAGRLAVKQASRTLFILDEPTTGLHFSDVEQLVDCFGALLDVGHSLLVIEHNLQMMMAADWIIDLGPGAAEEGGRIVTEGTPEEVAACEASVTGSALAEAFQRRDEAMAALDEEELAMDEAE